MSTKQYFIYILTNYNKNVLYTGVTSNLKVRVYSHKNNIGAEFTSKYKVHSLIYYEVFDNVETAIKREKSIKNLVKRKKIEMINKFNSEWKDLYCEI